MLNVSKKEEEEIISLFGCSTSCAHYNPLGSFRFYLPQRIGTLMNTDAAEPDSYPIAWTPLLDCFVVSAGRVMQSSGDYSTHSGLYPQCIYSPGAARSYYSVSPSHLTNAAFYILDMTFNQ